MIRALFWLVAWACTLGMAEIDVRYTDGLHIQLHSWTKLLRQKREAKAR